MWWVVGSILLFCSDFIVVGAIAAYPLVKKWRKKNKSHPAPTAQQTAVSK